MSQTNGASLEDCHSNVFILTELTGVRWKKFVSPNDPSRGVSELAADRVLWAYGACLSSGLLAVWRRSPSPSAPLALAAEKELWVFWYSQEEPPQLATITNHLTNSADDSKATGSWEDGIAYDCKTLLFKALHNLIERNLLSSGYVRIGKWFVQPVESDNTCAYLDAFNFSFFVHGDVHVCVTVNTQRQPPVYKLSKTHLAQRRLEVILAPWSWTGVLNPAGYGLPDSLGEAADVPGGLPERRQALAGRQWKEWTHFYPLPKPDATENVGWVDPDEKEKQDAAKAAALPQMVEVSVGGVRILHPSAYIFIDSGRNAAIRKTVAAKKTQPSPQKRSGGGSLVQEMLAGSLPNGKSIGNCPVAGFKLVERAVEDLTLSRRNSASDVTRDAATPTGSSTPLGSEDAQWPQWDAVDSSSKESCACTAGTSAAASPKPPTPTAPQIASKGAQKFGVPSIKCEGKAKSGKTTPFHRRSPLTVMDESRAQPAQPKPPAFFALAQPSVSVSSAGPSSAKLSPPPSISLPNNLPPHEPITQMISPVPSSSGHEHPDAAASAFPTPSTSQREPKAEPPDPAAESTSKGFGGHEPYSSQKQHLVKLKQLPSELGRKRRVVKRPRLAELDSFLETEEGEQIHLPNFLYARDNRTAPWDCAPSSSPDPAAITGLISIRQASDGSNHYGYGHADPARAPPKPASLPPAQPNSLPENFMDTAPTQPSDVASLDHSMMGISPPASNERDESRRALERHGGAVGPPSVGPYVNIYPTPPTPQVATSPESLHQHHSNLNDTAASIATAVLPSSSPSELVNDPQPLRLYPESEKFASLDAPLPSAQLQHQLKSVRFQYNPAGRRQRRENPEELAHAALLSRMVEQRAAQAHPGTPRGPHRIGTSPYAANIASPYAHVNPRTPINPHSARLDIHSPLSNASFRNVNSVDNQLSCTSASGGAEAHGLVAVVLLSDSALNLHRDTNFDSCPACACGQLNISGAEMGAYGAPASQPKPHSQMSVGGGDALCTTACQCGFSAVRYRSLAFRSGLFAEDEQDTTGTSSRRMIKGRVLPPFYDTALLNLLRHQSLVRDIAPQVLYPSSINREIDRALGMAGVGSGNGQDSFTNQVELRDLAEKSSQAMEAACLVMDCTIPNRSERSVDAVNMIDRWGLRKPWNDQEPVDAESFSVVKSVGQVLERSMGCLRGLSPDSVEGPLSWRGLVRKAAGSRPGDSEDCAPEPVPLVLLTADKDLVQISPLSLRLWDKLLLDPFSSQKDVIYVAVVPEQPFIISRAQTFFRELSKTYESFRFGRHCPFTKALPRDGILAGGPKAMSKRPPLPKEATAWLDDPEFKPESAENKNRLRAYAQVCLSMLGPLLQQNESMNAFDKNIFKDVGKENSVPSGSDGMPPPSAPDPNSEGAASLAADACEADGDTGKLPHVVVVYLVNPCSPDRVEDRDQQRLESDGKAKLSVVALLRSYLQMIQTLPRNLLPYVQLEIVDLKTLMDCTASQEKEEGKYVDVFGTEGERSLNPGERVWERRGVSETLRTMALSVYSQTRNVTAACLSTTQAKCLTGLGPTASYLHTVQARLKLETDATYRIYCPPYVLPSCGPGKAIGSGRDMSSSKLQPDEANVLYVSYCLSEKQNWLLVTATDQTGSMLESSLINISTLQERQLARSGEVIRGAMNKLWKFIMSVLGTGCHAWRLVVGRLGRLGHGELKAWAQLLSKGNLKKTSLLLKEQCKMCTAMPSVQETPSILSAALVSLEPEANLRIFPRLFRPDERFGLTAKLNPLSTPEDASTTHILVFPTSAFSQVTATIADQNDGFGMDEMDFDFPAIDDDIGINLEDIEMESSSGLPQSGGGPGRFQSGFINESAQVDISLQPLAMGHYVSSAPAKGLPLWFWAQASGARRRSPVHLRSALHIHVARVMEEDIFSDPVSAPPKGRKADSDQNHPLDSRKPPDVLRTILETYNALSWLSVELGTGDRKSCLPIHMQALLRLYHATNAVLQH